MKSPGLRFNELNNNQLSLKTSFPENARPPTSALKKYEPGAAKCVEGTATECQPVGKFAHFEKTVLPRLSTICRAKLVCTGTNTLAVVPFFPKTVGAKTTVDSVWPAVLRLTKTGVRTAPLSYAKARVMLELSRKLPSNSPGFFARKTTLKSGVGAEPNA